MKLRLVLLAIASAVALRAADALPLFNATLTMGREHRFVLIDPAGKTSPFLSLGETFAGYTLKAYEAKTGVLELERDGKVSRLTLVADAATANAPAAPTPATIADAEAVLNKMHFEEMLERGIAQQKKAVLSQFQQVGARMVSQGADPADVAVFQKKIAEEILGVLDAKKLRADVSKIYSETFTKEELDSIAAFYSTPLGEMMASKLPTTQEKLGAVIQSRMSEVIPKVQQMGAEFAMSQKAKREAGGGAPVAPKPAAAPAPKQ